MITAMHRHLRTIQIVLLVSLLGPAAMAARDRQPAQAARDFSQWEKDVAAFEAADRTNPPPKDAILFVGSSTIVRWATLQEDFPDQRVINRGFGGNQIVDSTHFADRMIFPYRPRKIFLRAGGNDLHAGKSPQQVFQDFKDFVATIHAQLPDTEIVYISLAPSIARWEEREPTKTLNALVKDYVKKGRKLTYIETYDTTLDASGQPRPELFVEDKLHFSPEGYKLLIGRVRPFVK
jgi:lysophospholipase L1-like esterase